MFRRARNQPCEQRPCAAIVDDPVPTRPPEEVDARTRAARRKRLHALSEDDGRDPEVILDDDADARLEIAFASFRSGALSRAAYRELIEGEISAARERNRELRAMRREMHPKLYEIESEDVEADLEAAEWRLRWIEDQEYGDQFRRDGFADAGKWARFEYADHHGEITQRSISNWEQRGPYIVGWDRDRRAERTFRQDRISSWASG